MGETSPTKWLCWSVANKSRETTLDGDAFVVMRSMGPRTTLIWCRPLNEICAGVLTYDRSLSVGARLDQPLLTRSACKLLSADTPPLALRTLPPNLSFNGIPPLEGPSTRFLVAQFSLSPTRTHSSGRMDPRPVLASGISQILTDTLMSSSLLANRIRNSVRYIRLLKSVQMVLIEHSPSILSSSPVQPVTYFYSSYDFLYPFHLCLWPHRTSWTLLISLVLH